MPKKKRKNGGQKDARGYSSTNMPSKPIVKSVTKKKGFGPSSSFTTSGTSSRSRSSTSTGTGTNTTGAGVVAGKSKGQIKFSQRAQDEIVSLLDKLKESLLASSSSTGTNTTGTTGTGDDEKKILIPTMIHPMPILSMDDKKTVKKIASLVRTLHYTTLPHIYFITILLAHTDAAFSLSWVEFLCIC